MNAASEILMAMQAGPGVGRCVTRLHGCQRFGHTRGHKKVILDIRYVLSTYGRYGREKEDDRREGITIRRMS